MDTCLVVNLVSEWVGGWGCVRESGREQQNERESNNSWVDGCAGCMFLSVCLSVGEM